MPLPRTIEDARRSMAAEQKNAREIAKQQEEAMRAGYHRTSGFDPSPRARAEYKPEADRPLEPSAPLIADETMKPKTKRRSFGLSEGDQ